MRPAGGLDLLARRPSRKFALAAALICALTATGAQAAPVDRFDPVRFFTGRTHGEGVIKILAAHRHGIHIDGEGVASSDGSLTLVQRIDEDGKAPRTREWTLRRSSPDHYSATLSDAVGPVLVERIDDGIHIRFRAKGGSRIEQWLSPQPGDRVVRNHLVVHAHGVRVAMLDETIRKYD